MATFVPNSNPAVMFDGSDYVTFRARLFAELDCFFNCGYALDDIPVIEGAQRRNQRIQMEKKAFGILFSRLTNRVLYHFKHLREFRPLLEALDDRYMHASNARILQIEEEIRSLRLDVRGDAEAYFDRLDILITQLRDAGEQITDARRARMYLTGLPRVLMPIGQTCSGLLDSANYGSDKVRGAILRECINIRLYRHDEQNNGNRNNGSSRDSRQNANNGQASTSRNGPANNTRSNSAGTSRNSNNGSNSGSRNANGNNSQNGQANHNDRNGRPLGYRGRNFDKSKVTCYRCHVKGHYSNECPRPPNSNGGGSAGPSVRSAQASDDLVHCRMCVFGDSIENRELPTVPENENRELPKVPENEIEFNGDSGCNCTIINRNPEFLFNVREISGPEANVRLADSKLTMTAKLQGDLFVSCVIDGVIRKGIIRNVIFVPSADSCFLSTTNYMLDGFTLHAEKRVVTITNPENVKIFQGMVHEKPRRVIFKLTMLSPPKTVVPKFVAATASKTELGSIIHKRFGHMNSRHVSDLPKMVIGVSPEIKSNANKTNCEVCAYSKMCELPFESIRNRAVRIRQLIHCDLMGPIEPTAEDGSRFALVILDDWSNFGWVRTLKSKDECLENFKLYVNTVNRIDANQISTLRCDNGTEFTNARFLEFCDKNGIIIEFVPPHTPQLNSKIERYNGTIGNRLRAFLFESHAPLELWYLAIEAAVYVINRSPTDSIDCTPHERWHGRKPDVSHIRSWGSVARVLVPKQGRRKLDHRAWNGLLVGFTSMGYKIYDIRSRDIVVSRQVLIDETKDVRHLSSALVQDRRTPLKIEGQTSSVYIANKCTTSSNYEPQTFEEAMSCSESSQWKRAVSDELKVMEKREVWEIVPKIDTPLIDTKWVFRRKPNADGTVKYKARLCARGFLDKNPYTTSDTYSPTAKMATIRTILALAVDHEWKITHLDVTAAFLYGILTQVVHSKIPKGVEVSGTNKILRFKKSIYGLKVAAHNWNVKMVDLLERNQLHPVITEPCVFTRKPRNDAIIVVVFVDDFLITGSDNDAIRQTIEFLHQNLEIRDLGPPNKFLGIRITLQPGGMQLDQQEYFEELAEKFNVPRKSFATPMEENLRIIKSEIVADENYPLREILGSLMYGAVATRPDIAFAVNALCRVQDVPAKTTFKYAQRIVSYLAYGQEVRLTYLKSDPDQRYVLEAQTDASFAGDLNDRKSTSGLVIKLGRNTIHWRCCKQGGVTKSTQEAEYVSLSTGESELRSIFNLLTEMGFQVTRRMYADNTGAIRMAHKRDSARCRHVDVAYRVIEEVLAKGEITIEHRRGTELEADLLTKSLKAESHSKLIKALFNLE